MSESEVMREVMNRLTKIETLLENINEMQELKLQIIEKELELVKEQLKVANKRISDLESAQTWTIKTAVGGLISGAIGLLFLFKE